MLWGRYPRWLRGEVRAHARTEVLAGTEASEEASPVGLPFLEVSLRAVDPIGQLREEFRRSLSVQHIGAFMNALELRNLFLVGELVATAAKQRKESRGGHYREDYPGISSDKQIKAIIMQQADDRTIQVKEEIIDPEWLDMEDALGKGRWG